jgi:hypothetical protein
MDVSASVSGNSAAIRVGGIEDCGAHLTGVVDGGNVHDNTRRQPDVLDLGQSSRRRRFIR